MSRLKSQREGEGDWRLTCFAPTAVCVCMEGGTWGGGGRIGGI